MKDFYGRPVKSIRISVTEDCNLNCFYCHNEGQLPSKTIMSPEEIEQILSIAEMLGIRDVKFTGGEPLLREDIIDIIRRASKHMKDVSLTTNGTLLAPMAKKLYDAGLNRINVSLDSSDREKYKKITGKDMLDKVLDGISAAVEAGLYPVKVNIVALSDDIEDMMKTVKDVWRMGAMPQIIELVNVGETTSPNILRIEKFIASRAIKVRERNMHRRKIYTLKDDNGCPREVEIVRPMHNTEFCANCTRIRVTSGGMLKPCLMHNQGLVDILTPLRKGAGREELVMLFKKAIMNRFPYWR